MNQVAGPGRRSKPGPVDLPEPDALLEEQVDYYRARAPEYDDWWLRIGRYAPDDEFGRRWEAGKRDLDDALRAFAPTGTVLELAAGTGNLTAALAGIDSVEHITAVDSSEEALAIARTKVADPARATFVHADVFAWRPPQQFEVVAFGFWLSHVPAQRFADFWQLVRDRASTRRARVSSTTPCRSSRPPAGRPSGRDAVEPDLARPGCQHPHPGRRSPVPDREARRGARRARARARCAGMRSATVREHQQLFISGEAVPRSPR